ncbi:hypothetical protein [Nonomuraea sp. NPDC002799]
MRAGLALLLGGAALLGANAALGGVLNAAPAPPAATGTAGHPPTAGQKAEAGQAPTGEKSVSPRAGAEAQPRRIQQDAPAKNAATAGATPGTAGATSGAVEPGMVAGSTSPEDVLADGPEPGDVAGYKADGPSRHTDQRAAEYFRSNWGPDDKALRRLKDIRTVGGYLRIYTDLPETAGNSATALTLCERGLEYLRAAGVTHPVVFVQAEFGGNGNPVLANILGPSDTTCRVTHPAPD